MLPLGRKNARKCTECELTCHANCAHLVPDFCGMSMETANTLLSDWRAIKKAQASQQPAQASIAPAMGRINLGNEVDPYARPPPPSQATVPEPRYQQPPQPQQPPVPYAQQQQQRPPPSQVNRIPPPPAYPEPPQQGRPLPGQPQYDPSRDAFPGYVRPERINC